MGPRSNYLIYLLLFFLVTGCATTPRSKAELKRQEIIKNTSSVMVIVLQSDVYRLTAVGIREKVEEWCDQADRNLQDAAVNELGAKPVLRVKTLPDSMRSSADRANLNDTRALSGAVLKSIRLHASDKYEQTFHDKIVNFDYSLGAEVKSLAKGADALLFVSCIDINPTAGRTAAQAGMLLVTLPALLFGGAPTVLPGEFTAGVLMLVEAETGLILWHTFYQSTAAHDVSNPMKATELMKTLLKDFPI